MTNRLTIVTGYFGAPIHAKAAQLARERGVELLSLDEEIVRRDGRSIKRLVMMNGEHGYRNLEYEVLKELADSGRELVVSCGDGVLYDDDSRNIILQGTLVIAGEKLSPDQLWEKARLLEDSYHAFMAFGTQEEKRRAFDDLIQRQKILFGGLK